MHVAEVELKLGVFLTEALQGRCMSTVRTGRCIQTKTAYSKAMHCKRVSVRQTASVDVAVKRTVLVPNGNRMPVLSLAASSFTDIKDQLSRNSRVHFNFLTALLNVEAKRRNFVTRDINRRI